MDENGHLTEVLLRTLIWALACVIISLLVSIGGVILGLSQLPPAEAKEIAMLLVERRALGRGVTLFLIVPCLVMLTITGRVTGEAAVAALSAIAGYMLASAGNQ